MFRSDYLSLKPEIVYEQHYREIKIERNELMNSNKNQFIVAMQKNQMIRRDEYDEEERVWRQKIGPMPDIREVRKARDLTSEQLANLKKLPKPKKKDWKVQYTAWDEQEKKWLEKIGSFDDVPEIQQEFKLTLEEAAKLEQLRNEYDQNQWKMSEK